MKSFLLYFIFLSFLSFSYSQEYINDEDYEYVFENFSFKNNNPFIDLSIGNTQNNIDKSIINSNILKSGSFDAKFGFIRLKKLFKELYVMKGTNKYLGIQANNNSLNLSKEDLDGIKYDSWRISIGSDGFYGYKINENINLLLCNDGNLGLMWLDFNKLSLDSIENNYLNYLSDGPRWSKEVANNIKIYFFDNVGINIGFSRTVVYTRLMFWYFLGSEILYGLGNNAVDWFVKEISKSSPYSAPIIYFALNTAYNYAMYELRKSRMNWPFDTSKPLIYDNFKIGLTFKF